MTTKIPSSLEKAIFAFFRERSSHQRSVNCELLRADAPAICRELATRLEKYADCYFVMRELSGRDSVVLCCADGLLELLQNVVSEFDVLSLVYHDGGLTFSADCATHDNSLEIHLTSRGTLILELEEIAKRFGGQLY